jgi:hypothetical protein
MADENVIELTDSPFRPQRPLEGEDRAEVLPPVIWDAGALLPPHAYLPNLDGQVFNMDSDGEDPGERAAGQGGAGRGGGGGTVTLLDDEDDDEEIEVVKEVRKPLYYK